MTLSSKRKEQKMKSIEFVFVSKDDDFKLPRELTTKLEEEHPELKFSYVANNH